MKNSQRPMPALIFPCPGAFGFAFDRWSYTIIRAVRTVIQHNQIHH